LGGEELAEGFERGDDGPWKMLGLVQGADFGFGGLLLGLASMKNRGAGLRANVVALTVELRRIVGIKEDVEEVVVVVFGGIVGDANAFRVTRVAAADGFVVGGFARAAGVAAGDVGHAFELLKRGFGTPEAAAGEDSGFALHDFPLSYLSL